MLTTNQQYALIAQLGLIEGLKAGAFTDSAAKQAAVTALASVTSPDATDLPTALTLVNEIKTKLNAVIAALKTA
ncbi:hypothetical protein [Pseudomonas phage COT4]|uniref:Uncharacterized protein n=1 Tax=Pseudomonas phage M5.1 TaxID=2873460 RepID=A0AAE8XE35_9CAUD|nr:hypothetical protein QGX13_gp168 [Pseudomonas phage M5.1]UAV89656.1 hypothetical protein M51_74 [Pseudomonas phage M5.1]UGL61256.1 hypothetical protein [Pseudomonas phage COT4]